jgi:hypothetical protein
MRSLFFIASLIWCNMVKSSKWIFFFRWWTVSYWYCLLAYRRKSFNSPESVSNVNRACNNAGMLQNYFVLLAPEGQPRASCSDVVIVIRVYLMTLFSNSDYTASNERLISERWNRNDVEGSGRGLFQCTIPIFAWRDREKPRKPSVSIAGIRT